jgi:transcription factor SFP1
VLPPSNAPFRCPKPNCSKSYNQASGLKYHLTHGQCNYGPVKDRRAVTVHLLLPKEEVQVTSRSGTVRGSTAGAGARMITPGPAAFGAPQAILTSADEVDARLRSMNEEFMRSLVGLGSGGACVHDTLSGARGEREC